MAKQKMKGSNTVLHVPGRNEREKKTPNGGEKEKGKLKI